LRHAWRCEACGASDTVRGGGPDYCPVCGADRPDSREFLRPAGFSVDPRERAHSNTDTLAYVPPQDPVVSTRDAPWQALPVPEFGRSRCSREGLVYYSNTGPNGAGYAICLHCGRSEGDLDDRQASSLPPALVDHKPLRYRKGNDLCPGNYRPFSIKRNLALGLEVATDVFELQPQHRLDRAAANALAIALREALAQELGVEADEMGFAVARTRNALGAACVLTSDAPDGKNELDRTAALAFLRAYLKLPNDLVPEDRFVDGAELSLAPLDEIDRELRSSARSSAPSVPADAVPGSS